MNKVPADRIQAMNDQELREDGAFVVYWMVVNRRPHWNYSLDHAIWWAKKLGRPLVVLTTLKIDYPWASDRLHRFMLQDMAAHAAHFKKHDVCFYPFVEQEDGDQDGLLEALAKHACLIVSDDYPCFFIPAMQRAVAKNIAIRFDSVDSNGLMPIRTADKTHPTAYAFRRYLQKTLPQHLLSHPSAQPLRASSDFQNAKIPAAILKKWPRASAKMLAAGPEVLSELAIDHSVGPAAIDGGYLAADKQASHFLHQCLKRYGEHRNDPDHDAQSNLSPYLHFGQISAHAIFHRLAQQENWDINRLSQRSTGSREGWWGMSKNAEAFLDEVITWRELGQNMCVTQPDTYDKYSSLPDWAQRTLAEHVHDARPYTYTHRQLEAAETHDPVWNAAQRQLVSTGSLHNYMRMLWGKKVLEWSSTPQHALRVLIDLNNKYAVDGRDPNSYSGIFWIFGRYDRPWPEREIFGKIRYMSSDNTVRKLEIKQYLKTWESFH